MDALEFGDLNFLPRLAFYFTQAYPLLALSTVQTLKKT